MVRDSRGPSVPSPTVLLPIDTLSESRCQTEFSCTPNMCEQADARTFLVCFLGLMTPQLSGAQVFCRTGPSLKAGARKCQRQDLATLVGQAQNLPVA